MENDVKIYGQQDFSLPHDVVKLPSEGKFYKNKKKNSKTKKSPELDMNAKLNSLMQKLKLTEKPKIIDLTN
jgi:hypothetical protein